MNGRKLKNTSVPRRGAKKINSSVCVNKIAEKNNILWADEEELRA